MSTPAAVSLSAQSSPPGRDSNAEQPANCSNELQLQILAKLSTVVDKVESIDQRVASNERALAEKTSMSSGVVSSTRSPSTSVVAATTPVSRGDNVVPSLGLQATAATAGAAAPEEPLLPSVDFLKANPHIQAQVDSRVKELHQLHDLNATGNIRSQRVGGTGNILVKKEYNGLKIMFSLALPKPGLSMIL